MSTDPVFRGLIKEWLTGLPADERDTLLDEVRAPGENSPPAAPTEPTGSLKAGQDLYDKQHGRNIAIEGAEHTTNGKWS